MTGLIPDAGLYFILNSLGSQTVANGLKFGLYNTSHTPAYSDVLSTYEAISISFPGYSEKETPGYSTPTVTADVASTTFNSITWTQTGTGSQQAFGWFCYQNGSGSLLAAGAFDSPIGMYNSGDFITLTLTMTCGEA